MVWSDWGWSFGEGANLYFSQGTKNLVFFLALSGRETSLVQTFCESCQQLDITHPSVHMTRTFVIQGCSTLKCNVNHCLNIKIVGPLTLAMTCLPLSLHLHSKTL